MEKIDPQRLKLFTGRANPQLAKKICDACRFPWAAGARICSLTES